MLGKFAYFTFPKSIQDIPINSAIVRKMPKKLQDLYIMKKTPLRIEEAFFLDAAGYEVQVPILLSDLAVKKEKDIYDIFYKMLLQLQERDVEIILPPKEWNGIFPDVIRTADGKEILPFFIMLALVKALKTVKKDLKFAEVVIIDGKDKKTEVIIDSIYPNVNYLSIVTQDPESFAEKVDDIYEDVGLNLQIESHNGSVLQRADVIIDLCKDAESYAYHYKRGAVIFELTGTLEKIKDLLRKRQDILVIDDLLLKYDNQYLTTPFCEMAYLLKNRYFRNYLLNGYRSLILSNLRTSFEQHKLSICGFYQLGTMIGSGQMTEILKNSGIEYIDKI